LWPWQDAARGLLAPPAGGSTIAIGALALAGFVLVTLLVHFGNVAERKGNPEPYHG
nr:hypothetical protein [Gemmatimonadota bacterium]